MLPARPVRFRLNGAMVSVAPEIPASETLLRWLRGPARLSGTKEGCAEGDCGACTVVLEEQGGARTPINACLVALGQLDGTSLRTVEGLAGPSGPHPIQRAMADANATQCGFCTPGFVMAAWAYAQEGGDKHEALAGNLCRCTGYRPILDALAIQSDLEPPLSDLPPSGPALFETAACRVWRPTTLDDLLDLRTAHPDAWLLAGGTDLGLLLSEGRDAPAEIILLLAIPELQRLVSEPEGLRIGAAVSYARLLHLIRDIPSFAGLIPMLSRLGSRQIRGLGTIGGNLGTASPIGDMLPPLLALSATIRLRAPAGTRDLPVADFLRGYRLNALAPGEIIESVFLPAPPPGSTFLCEKISKRYDQDISTVSAAILLRIDNGTIMDARLAFGGMAATAARALHTEAALTGAPWSPVTLDTAAQALAQDFSPLSDLRSTATYRQAAAAGLLRRLWPRLERTDLDLQTLAPI